MLYSSTLFLTTLTDVCRQVVLIGLKPIPKHDSVRDNEQNLLHFININSEVYNYLSRWSAGCYL